MNHTEMLEEVVKISKEAAEIIEDSKRGRRVLLKR